ncbi:seed biotin-containing protein SBP65-like [Cucurbita pepo subsp. pepo]|uniref:seed biotin-containing protein SBP65-like n=1 Tax=Cucurbita pepo subsp. pepo TaxID=3664 RepID=UPI000C9D39D0|nr:seed biotin-containing protein SBP65-like [Cucurbita pepo subsp. pepo]
MATEKLSRRDDTTKEKETQVERERVPQLASHFEAIAVHGKATDPSNEKATTPEETKARQRSDASGVGKETYGTGIARGTVQGREEERQGVGGEKPEDSHELAAQFESLADKVRDKRETNTENERERQARADKERIAAREREQKGSRAEEKQRVSEQAKEKEGEIGSRQNQPSLEEISNYRAIAQQKSNEAIMAAKERYDKANKKSLQQGVEAGTGEAIPRGTEEAEDTVEEGNQYTGLETVKETLTSAAKTAKDYTAPIAEKAKDYTVSAGRTTAHYLGEKAVVAKDVAIESGKVAAGYAGKAAEDLKDKTAVAGWSTAHYSCDTAVEGTKAAARLVKGAAEYAGAIAAKPLSAAKNVAESTGETVKDYTARKKEEAQRESMYKQTEKDSMYEKTKETFEGGIEEVKERGGERGGENRVEEDRSDGGILGAIGETIYEIAQTTKEIVIGPGDETGKQSTLGFELGQEEGEEKGQEHEKKEHYETAAKKEHRA